MAYLYTPMFTMDKNEIERDSIGRVTKGVVWRRYARSDGWQSASKETYTSSGGLYGVIRASDDFYRTPLRECVTDNSRSRLNESHAMSYNYNDFLNNYTTNTYTGSQALQKSETHYQYEGEYYENPNNGDYTNFFTNIPFFYENDTDSINRYIQNGDDSGAANYDMLYPQSIVVDINMDGEKNPHFYFKNTIEGGSQHFEQSTAITIASFSNPLLFMTFYLKNGENRDLSYFQIKDKIGAFVIAGLKISASPSIGQSENNTAELNVITIGNPSDTSVISPDGSTTINLVAGYPGEDYDFPDDSDDWGDNTDTRIAFSGANTLTKTYRLNESRLNDLGDFLWSASFTDNIKLLNNSPIENIISVKAMPVVKQGNEETIVIGNVDTGIYGEVIANSDIIRKEVGRFFVGAKFNNFLDYTATKITIFLPYIGFKELNPTIIMNNTINVYYVFDCILGKCMAVIEAFSDSTTSYTQIECYEGNCGIDIAIASSNRAQMEAGLVSNAIGGILSAAGGNIGGVISNAESAATAQFHSQSNGVGTPSLMVNMSNQCYLIVETPKTFTPPKYAHYHGYPCHLYKKLSTLSGYTVCDNFICNDIEKATSEERNMIQELLNTGVYL